MDVVERVARKLCEQDGFDPDLPVVRGSPMVIAGQCVCRLTGSEFPTWRLYAQTVKATAEALEAESLPAS